MSARDVIVNNLTFYGDMTPADLERQADHLLSTLRSAGWAVVPVEPTEGMLNSGWRERGQQHSMTAVYKAMLKAAQEDSRE